MVAYPGLPGESLGRARRRNSSGERRVGIRRFYWLKLQIDGVTLTDEVSMAMSMVSNHENQFRLVMVKLNMPGLHDLAFVDLLHEKDIPVVFISSGGSEDTIWKTLAKGPCYFLEEPILFEDLQYLWLIAHQSKPKSAIEAQHANKACREKEERKIDNDGNESKQGEKREELRPAMMNFNRDNHIPKETEKRREHKIGFAKKRKILWTLELRQKFTEALEYLGGIESNIARPKAIQKLMKVSDLTLNQISSYMQRYKLQLKRNKVTIGYGSYQAGTSSNISGKTTFPSSLGSSSYRGIPTSFAPLNASPKQDLNSGETQESDIHKLQSVLSNSFVANELASQIDGAIVGNSIPNASSTLQNLPENEYEEFFRSLEDIETDNFGLMM
ncbi:two-component response regulator ARR18-like [Glycine soja]|uniref:two-component response regulator ARR18-like n=1 Tax=Glycine max TaxID=3847 RepID=UPI0007192544|nr:two-component response regulator ARR18-like [Glycine max]XP_028246719.1 two-component response regulator ARR18-like [Glycine soja]|eukprot:XP_006586471.2 two-component response regulator ARR18-like [Glycine max]